MIESAIVTLADVVFHSISGQGNAKKRASRLQSLHQLHPAAIRQTDVADKNIKMFCGGQIQSRPHGGGGLHFIAAPSKKISQRTIRVLMILDQQNMHGLTRFDAGGGGGGAALTPPVRKR